LANDYDKILKENIAVLFLPLSEKYLHIRIARTEELKDKLQTTIEKEPDFIRIVETDKAERFILHLEFQTQDEEDMIYRMQEYYGLLRRKYQVPVKQFVIYLGRKTSRMQTSLALEEIFTGFQLTSLRDYSYQSLLNSQIPEEIILAILSNFKEQKPAEVIRLILRRLYEIGTEEIVLRKYIRQLSVLARLRNLTKETHKQVQDMGLTYDITKDYLYQEGLEKGLEKGKKEMIIELLKDGTLSVQKIAALAKVPVERVKELAKELKK
jgi:predicted transposase YdaD